jgi:hypothetical protein
VKRVVNAVNALEEIRIIVVAAGVERLRLPLKIEALA